MAMGSQDEFSFGSFAVSSVFSGSATYMSCKLGQYNYAGTKSMWLKNGVPESNVPAMQQAWTSISQKLYKPWEMYWRTDGWANSFTGALAVGYDSVTNRKKNKK